MKEVSIIINGIGFESVEFPYKNAPNKCESCDIFDHCVRIAKKEMIELCKVAGENCIYKFSVKKELKNE